ncbi:hypothetical protein GTP91_00880 [Rugamonas sp. FT82W]|uniref:Uncharacterized protein n=1 Tax=Duganella vulcania TaxID=2692166 RepID=A0A845FY44_9BURK|nr:hypothetical protein [Duganella vulcania]MYM85727.1 hypothetical protein [Duganella vulcania]
MAVNHIQIDLVIELLRQTTSLDVVRKFLAARNLKHSAGSWDDLKNKRILPALENYEISYEDLIQLLRSAEESGRQHIFLYHCNEAVVSDLMNRDRIKSLLVQRGLDSLLKAPKIMQQPVTPEIVDVRWTTANIDLNLCVKEVELRVFSKFLGEEKHGENTHRVYGTIKQRAVNFAKLHRDGLLEIRMASLENSTKYESNIRRFWDNVGELIPRRLFSEISLSNAKKKLWTDRDELSSLVRYTDTVLRDDYGNVLRAATGPDAGDLKDHIVVGESLDHMLNNDDSAYCDGTNFWFKKNNDLSADVHVLLNGDLNEFALPANCSEEDYVYVLNHVRTLNR